MLAFSVLPEAQEANIIKSLHKLQFSAPPARVSDHAQRLDMFHGTMQGSGNGVNRKMSGIDVHDAKFRPIFDRIARVSSGAMKHIFRD